MFIIKVKLDVKNPSVRQALNNAQDMHRNIQKLFGETREEAQVLYRVVRRREAIYVYIQSGVQPKVDSLPCNGMSLVNIANMDEKLNRYRNGDRLKIDLLAYPSKKVAGDSKNSKRVSLHTVEERMQWLSNKLGQNGMKTVAVAENGRESVKLQKQSGEYTLNGYRYSGVVEVTDSEVFVQALRSGIGAEKAYGFGMVFAI